MKHDTKKNPTACAGVVSRFNRYTIEGVSVVKDGERLYLAATDGRTLSMVRCELDQEAS